MKDIDHLPLMKNKLVKIYNGIDTALDFYDKKEAQDILLKGKDIDIKNKTILLSIGELHKNKGYDLFIPNLKKVERDFVYLVIGEGEERNHLIRQIKGLGLNDKVYFLGRIENAYKYIKMTDIFVLPSRTEAFPYVLLEAGLSGTCVLASNVGGIGEVIEKGKNGVLYDINTEEVVGRLEELIDNPGVRDGYGKNIKDKVLLLMNLGLLFQKK